MSQPTKPIHERLGFHSLIVTTPPVAYVWYGGNRIFVHEIGDVSSFLDEGEVSPEAVSSFTFGEDQDSVGVLLALEAINRRLEDDEEAFRAVRET